MLIVMDQVLYIRIKNWVIVGFDSICSAPGLPDTVFLV